jgi:two-component system CheB/CheR fusion protein
MDVIDEMNNRALNEPETNASDLFIVGLGASAGGIQALRQFFEQVSADSGMAYVVILHLSPDHDSQLAKVLQVSAKIPVLQVTEKLAVRPDHIYVISPNQHLTMEDGHIDVSPNITLEDRRAPVDIFFRTLAMTHGPKAICAVLSGTGADGSMGLKHIKERGGAAFVQNPREAEFNEMPRSSIATDLVDEVLPVAAIPGKILAYKNKSGTLATVSSVSERAESDQSALREIFTHLRLRTGHDFSNYKRPTLLRRIERRIHMRVLPDLSSYASYMREHPEETSALLKDILISVTNFFRDQKAFESIEKDILPKILAGKSSEDQVRIWVAGCATGEEAYSLAMLVNEKIMGVIDAPKLQIFATDIDETAIAHAREGVYTINDAADVSAERLKRFFTKEGEFYRLRREIRETVLFAQHNFIKDPPFSRLDMVSCRNVLIYLNQVAQERVVETFHFALKPGGFLFLGASETVDGASDLYIRFNKEYHIFQSRQVAARSYPLPDAFPTFHIQRPKNPLNQQTTENTSPDRITFGELHQRLLEQYAPPSVIINEEYEIVHLTDSASKYLQVSGGEPTQNLLKLVRPDLRLDLRSALYQSTQKRTAIEVKGLQVTIENHTPETINLHVRPVLREDDIARGFILVLFEPTAEKRVKETVSNSDDSVARQLEDELIRVKKQLRTSIEQHEFQAEELKASNEELQAMNEELRSSAEELETSKEELQSINEELSTVNQELKVKIEETTVSGNNLRNLINSVDIGTMFLDRSMRIMLFTPAIRHIFNLIPGDFGRPLSDITNRLAYQGLEDDTQTVLEKLQLIEREVQTTDGKTFMMHILPYRTEEDRINGVVITFVDISKRKEAENNLKASEARLSEEVKILNDLHAFSVQLLSEPDLVKAATETVKVVCKIMNADMGSLHLRDGASKKLAYVAHCGKNENLATYTSAQIETIMETYWQSAVRHNRPVIVKNFAEENGNHRLTAEADGIHAACSIPLTGREQKAVGVLSVYFTMPHEPGARELYIIELYAGQIARLIERNHAEQSLRISEERLRVTMESATDFAIITLGINGIIMNWNKGAINIFGYTEKEAIGQPADIIFTSQDQQLKAPDKEMKTALKKGRALDERWHKRKDGSSIFMSGVLTPMFNEGKLTGFVKVARDITAQKQAEDALMALEERYRIALKSAEMGTWDWNIESDIIYWNEQHYTLLGLEPGTEPVTSGYFMQFLHPADRELIQAALLRAIEEAGVFHAEFRIITGDKKETHWLSGYARALSANDRRVTRMVGVMYDITERKKLEKEKEEFLNIASHEIKTPLTSIKSYAEIVQDLFEESNSKEQTLYLNKLNIQIDRLNDLISDLLDTTKVKEGELPLHLKLFDLNELIRDRISDLEHLSHKHEIRLISGDIPAVTADSERIGQVLINLINNAIKYSPKGGEIIVTSQLKDGRIMISVKDQGIGISKEMQGRVFDRFFRVANAQTNTAPGMGLGLYISAGIIYRHKGTISVESNPGEGTTFSFTIPVSQEIIEQNAEGIGH